MEENNEQQEEETFNLLDEPIQETKEAKELLLEAQIITPQEFEKRARQKKQLIKFTDDLTETQIKQGVENNLSIIEKKPIYNSQVRTVEMPNGEIRTVWRGGPTNPSRVPEIFKTDINGRTICGSFKQHKKTLFETLGMTYEELKAHPTYYKQIICHANPETSKGWVNGRCKQHGSRGGRPLVHGTRSKYLPTASMDLNFEDVRESHTHLKDELTVLAGIIQRKIQIVNQSSDLANTSKVLAALDRLERAWKKLNGKEMKEAMEEAKQACTVASAAERAEKDLAELVPLYAKVFETEVKRKVAANEYIAPKQFLLIYQQILTVVNDKIKEPNDIREAQQRFVRILRESNIPAITGNGGVSGDSTGLEDKDEE